jgi:hypothetical protein
LTTEFASEATTSKREEFTNELTVAMEAGIKFGTLSIANTFTYDIETTTTSTMRQSTTTEVDV